MKLRTDFVTNSSSVSYIVTMNIDIVNCFIHYWNGTEQAASRVRLAEALKKYLCENGSVAYLHEHELYTCLMNFRDDDGECMSEEALTEEGANTDPCQMNEMELFDYIRGELIVRNRLSELLPGFGVTQVEQY